MKHISLKSDAESAQLVSMIPKDFSESESVWKRYLSRSLPPLKVYVTKYQNLLSLLKILPKRIDFVVFDEVHFFTSDAMFNCKTGYILAKSLTLLNNAVQIYMSATPEEILAPIRALTPLTIYYFPPQKRNDTCFYYQKTEELIPYIEASPSNEQWLIFVNSKQNGKQLQKMLRAKYGASEISYLDADAKETNAWSEIISQDSFSGKVLICTSVLDNGINLKDSSDENKVCHIVLPACEHTTFMQMLGRKRISPHANDSIKLYIQSISAMELQSHKRRLKRMQDAVWEWVNLFNHPEYVPVHPWDALLSMPICSLQNYIPNHLQFSFDVWNLFSFVKHLVYFPYHGRVMPFNRDTAGQLVEEVVQNWRPLRAE